MPPLWFCLIGTIVGTLLFYYGMFVSQHSRAIQLTLILAGISVSSACFLMIPRAYV